MPNQIIHTQTTAEEQGIRFWNYTSPQPFSITIGGFVVIEHDWVNYDKKYLPYVAGYLVCKKATRGYQVGDRVTPYLGVIYESTEDSIIVRFANSGIRMIRKDNGNTPKINVNDWDFAITAHAFGQ